MPKLAQVLDHRKIGRVAAREAATQLRLTSLEQVIERASPPALLPRLVLAGALILDQRRGVARVAFPAEQATLEHRVQRVGDDHCPAQWHPGGDHPLAESAQEVELGHAVEAGCGHPGGNLRLLRTLHAATPELASADIRDPSHRRDP